MKASAASREPPTRPFIDDIIYKAFRRASRAVESVTCGESEMLLQVLSGAHEESQNNSQKAGWLVRTLRVG